MDTYDILEELAPSPHQRARAKAKAHEIKRKPTFKPKPLSSAQLAGLELLLTGATDQAVADAVGVRREAVWSWRREHPVFMAELERRRAELYGSGCERLRSLIAKAVENISTKIEGGDVDASWNLLRCVGIFGNGGMNRIDGRDPEQLMDDMVEQRLTIEKIPSSLNEIMALDDIAPQRQQREQEIRQELYAEYGEP